MRMRMGMGMGMDDIAGLKVRAESAGYRVQSWSVRAAPKSQLRQEAGLDEPPLVDSHASSGGSYVPYAPYVPYASTCIPLHPHRCKWMWIL